MGRKGGFSCPGGEQKLLMELFCENNESMSGYFHAWVASKSLLMDVFYENIPKIYALSSNFLTTSHHVQRHSLKLP
jgi:hypothetical protein